VKAEVDHPCRKMPLMEGIQSGAHFATTRRKILQLRGVKNRPLFQGRESSPLRDHPFPAGFGEQVFRGRGKSLSLANDNRTHETISRQA